MHLKIHGKGGKLRYIPLAPKAAGLIESYLQHAGHRDDKAGPLFRPVKNNVGGILNKPLHPESVYQLIRHYADAARGQSNV